jgi:hypothetical protein
MNSERSEEAPIFCHGFPRSSDGRPFDLVQGKVPPVQPYSDEKVVRLAVRRV